MALKCANNEVAVDFLQNENLQSKSYTAAHISNKRTCKNNSNGLKYGLSELSNDKTYLETELPARKRLKPETELINSTIYLNKICKAVVNDDVDSDNVVNEGKYSSEISLSREQGFEDNFSSKELLGSNLNAEINTQSESSVLKFGICNSVFQSNVLDNQLKWDSDQCNFNRELEIHDIELNSENDLCENIDNDKISNRGTESETDFDDEVKKCYELLNLDVPRIAVSTTETKSANNNSGNKMIENSPSYKSEISNHNNKRSLYPQSTELVTNLGTMSNDINFGNVCLGKNLRMEDELLSKKEKNCEDNIEFKDESNSVLYTIVTSHSFLKTCNENQFNFSHKIFHNGINLGTEGNSLDSEFKSKDKNSTLKINNILNFNGTSVGDPNIFMLDTIQNHDSENNTEHLDLTIENTLNSDILKQKGINQNILQDHLKDDRDDVPSTVDDSGDVLSLYYESDFEFYETEEEINVTNLPESEPAMLAGTSENSIGVFHANPDHNNSCKYTGNEVKNVDNFILNERIDPVGASHSLDDKNCESNVLKGISNNDCGENKNDFDIKVNESFVSEYEISLLAEDADSIFSEGSLDSDYEISLLEADTDDEENKNDLLENKSDSNISSSCLPNGDEKDKKIEAISQEYINQQENVQTTNNVYLFEKETVEVISENKMYSKSISKGNIASSTEEKIPSNYQKNKVADKTDSDMKKSAQQEEIQTFSNIKSNEYTSVKHEPVTGGKIIQQLQTPVTLRYEKPDGIKKEPSENNNASYFPLKLEINKESQTKSKEILDSNKRKNSEEKALIVNTNKDPAGSACTDIASIAKIVKAELDVPDIEELKQNVTDRFQSSNKVVFNSKMNETKKTEEKVAIVTNEQFAECNFTDKAISEEIVKTDLRVSANNESKQDVKDKIPDYYEEEKEDLINPGWNKIKELSTDEERYQQVRDCWKSKNIPDPFKNLTYYSYRKHKVNREEDNTRQTKQHKRHASSNLNDKDAKRSRSCTYIFDDRIESINKKKEMKAKTIHDKMFNEVSRLTELQQQEEMGIQNFYGFDPRRQYRLSSLRRDYEQRVSAVTAQYEQQVNNFYDQYTSEINKLKNNRNEVLQFYSFYKGLNTDKYKDPTILTNTQMQELEEIENIYNQMDRCYR